jgi:hypothetical protein
MLFLIVGDDDDSVVLRSEEGEGGTDGEGDGEEEEEEEGSPMRIFVRKRGKASVLFQTRVKPTVKVILV